ncbi:RNA polymerase sigma factor [Pedococcus sp. NPDC057267]|uniref:RNA polymerase sigma factor n=1 Tax=Pedococcus sp. NPDC057267 TaxID=3346077 RepID=UPI003640CFE4
MSPGSHGVPEPTHDVDARAAALAFRQYVEPELQVLLRVAQSLTGNTADAEDLVQETLIRAYKAVARFDGRHPRAWLLTILRRTHMNMHRRQRPEVVADWNALSNTRPAFSAAEHPSAEDEVVDQSLHHELVKALTALDPRFREALWLVDVNDLTYADAAAVLGVPVGTVMSRLSRARDRVRRQVGPTALTAGRLR